MARFPAHRRYRPRKAGLSAPAIVYTLCLGLLLGWYAPEWWEMVRDAAPSRSAAPYFSPSSDRLSADFALCHSGGGTNCVVDGDTFWFRGEKIRIADIDTPETHGPRCPSEAALGAQATARLHDLLNAGSFSLESAGRETDRYGRRLQIVTRQGESIGGRLVAEGLARPWEGRRRSWCV